MAIRYLRRPPKAAARKEAARKAKRAVITPPEIGPAETPIEVMPEERAKLAEALAYFCVACGREHASGDIRHGDVVCAEAEIIAVISRAQ